MIRLLYFSWVRERIGKAEEDIDLPDGIDTVAGLVKHLKSWNELYQSALDEEHRIRIAVNQTHASPDQAIKDGDEIAFFPPVTGG